MFNDENIKKAFENVKEDILELRKEISEIKLGTGETDNFTIWLTGLPCSGKTTISRELRKELIKQGRRIVCLDGDNVRKRLNADLGFSKKDRKENLRRISHVAQLFNENKNMVIASFISPTNEYRKMIKEIIGNLKLIYVKCSVEECEKRDVKGMYKKARAGKLKGFTGVSAVFEEPEDADLVVDTEKDNLGDCVKKIIDFLGA